VQSVGHDGAERRVAITNHLQC